MKILILTIFITCIIYFLTYLKYPAKDIYPETDMLGRFLISVIVGLLLSIGIVNLKLIIKFMLFIFGVCLFTSVLGVPIACNLQKTLLGKIIVLLTTFLFLIVGFLLIISGWNL